MESDILHIISSQGGEVYGAVRLQKLVFILKHKYGMPLPFSFRKHYHGPFSKGVRNALLSLEHQGRIVIDRSQKPYVIRITKKGKAAIEGDRWFRVPKGLFSRKTDSLKEESYKILEKVEKY